MVGVKEGYQRIDNGNVHKHKLNIVRGGAERHRGIPRARRPELTCYGKNPVFAFLASGSLFYIN